MVTLCEREGDGLSVKLHYDPEDGCKVTVADERTQTAYILQTDSGAIAMDMFRHPFAYIRIDTVEHTLQPA